MDLCIRTNPRRRFAYGVTINDTDMRLWFCSRSGILVSQVFDFTRQHEYVIRFLLTVMYASPSGLGWDTTMRCVTNGAEVDDGSTRYDIDVRSSDGTTTTYRTIRLLSDTGSEYLRGKGTRVWLVRKMEDGVECGEPVVLKDSWVDSNLQMEGDNLNAIRNCETDPPTGDLLDKYLLTVSCHGKVYVDGKLDHTLCHLSGPDALHTRLRFRLQTSSHPPGARIQALGHHRHGQLISHSLGKMPIYRAHDHYRIVYSEVCEPLNTLTHLSDVFGVLSQAVKGMADVHYFSRRRCTNVPCCAQRCNSYIGEDGCIVTSVRVISW